MEEPEPAYLDAAGVAEYCGIKYASVRDYVKKGRLPEPDLVWFGVKLWLVDTIDDYRKLKWVRIHQRPMIRRREVTPPTGAFPNVVHKKPAVPRGRKDKRTSRAASSVGALKKPKVSTVSEDLAKEIAAELRGEGHYCTTADVMVLADINDEETLEHERRVLRQRILKKLNRRR